MPELSDEELRVLQGSKKLLDKMLGSPKTKRATEKLIKEHFPETQITDDIVEPVEKELQELRKDFKEFRDSLKGKELDSKLEKGVEYLKTERDFTDEGIEKLKKLMIEREIPSILDAAAVWEKRNPPKPQEPSIMAPTDWGFGRKTDDPDVKLLFEDEDAWAEKEARRAWAEETAKKGQIVT